ncbi:MAG: NAD-dependent epimerase/dehydratase family protein [Terriglobales bacterium]
MSSEKQAVIVTGAAGNLGVRLLSLLSDFQVYAVDVAAPRTSIPVEYRRIDLADPTSGAQFVQLIRESGATTVVHLAFIIDPVRMGVLDVPLMWKINVGGTERVIDAIAEANRTGSKVARFIYPSSVSVYGPDTPANVTEDYPMGAHTLAYAMHKQEAETLLEKKSAKLAACSTYVLRPHIYAGASMQNYLIGALRGTPTGRGRLGKWMRDRNVRLPLVLPMGGQYLDKEFQFVHVDDVARLIAYLLRRPDLQRERVVLNVPGKGPAVTLGEAARIAKAKVIRLPGRVWCRWTLQLMWKLGISGVPPEALPYMIGSYTMDARRLRAFLGDDYDRVMQFTVEQALEDSFCAPVLDNAPVALHAASPP